jgi:Asp-tRNA(Asn)/Glu-tRNA(Gln) amidotransferase A subunit family amidase
VRFYVTKGPWLKTKKALSATHLVAYDSGLLHIERGWVPNMTDGLFFMAATELAKLLRERKVTAVEVADAFLRRIDDLNDETNSFVTITHDLALESARRCDLAADRGRIIGPLHGVPVAIKDLFDLKVGVRNTFGSVPLADFVAKDTTPYIRRLEDAGAVIIGKTNAPEFGHKGITDNFVTGATSTPFDLSRNSGGSSGGSAAAVAAGLVPLAQGTDGGGSLRIPAAWCGVYGYKPSYGRVADVGRPDSSTSISPFVSAGPIARSVRDAALMLSVMSGPDSRDPYCLPDSGEDWSQVEPRGLHGARIGFSPDLGGFPVDPEVSSIVENAVGHFEAAGATTELIEIKFSVDHYELSALWERLVGILYIKVLNAIRGWGIDLLGDHSSSLTPEFLGIVEAAQSLTLKEIHRDQILRTSVQDTVQDAFDRYDFLVTPTLAVSPVKNAAAGLTVGPSEVNGIKVDPLIGWCLTFPFNFTGNPASSIPCGFTTNKLPVGMQIVGRQHGDKELLAASAGFEAVTPWLHTYPGFQKS